MLRANPIRESLTWYGRKEIILNQARRNKEVVYGSTAIKKHIGFLGREPEDVDLLTSNPRQSARRLEKTLDKKAGANVYYSKPAIHKDTYRVRHVGMDGREGTRDDIQVADYSKPSRNYKQVWMDKNQYVQLDEIEKDKKKSLNDPSFQFRHEKDQDDIRRIKLAREMHIRYRPRFSLR